MGQLVPVCPYLLEAPPTSQITFSHMLVANFYPLHGHDYYEMELVFRGKGRQWINNISVPMEVGSMYLLSPSDVHRLEADEEMHILSIHIIPSALQQTGFQDIQRSYTLQLPPQDFELYFSLAYPLISEKSNHLPYCNQKMLSVATLLLINLLRSGTMCNSSPAGFRMNQAIKYIQSNYHNPNLRLENVAGECYLSPCHFSTTFRRTVGCGFSEYLSRYRMYVASTLLILQDISVTDLAYEVGFSSLSHFFRTFKKTYNCTPKEYRDRYLQNPSMKLQESSWASSIVPAPQIVGIQN